MTSLTLSDFIQSLDDWTKNGSNLSTFRKIDFGEFKNFTIDGCTLIKMVAAIEKLEEKLGIDTKKFFTIPEEYYSLMASLKRQYYVKGRTEAMETYAFFRRVDENKESFKETKVYLKDVICLDKYDDDQQICLWIINLCRFRTAPEDLFEYLRCISKVLLNMVDFEAPLHTFMTILLVPLYEFLAKENQKLYFPSSGRKEQPPQRKTEKIYPKILYRNMTDGRNVPDLEISIEAQMIFSVLQNPQNYLEKKNIFELVSANIKNDETTLIRCKRFIRKFFPKTHVKNPRFKIDIQDFSVLQDYLKTKYDLCMKRIRFNSDTGKKYAYECFKLALTIVTKWEIAVNILKQLFPQKEASEPSTSSHLAVPVSLAEWFEHHKIFEKDPSPLASTVNPSSPIQSDHPNHSDTESITSVENLLSAFEVDLTEECFLCGRSDNTHNPDCTAVSMQETYLRF